MTEALTLKDKIAKRIAVTIRCIEVFPLKNVILISLLSPLTLSGNCASQYTGKPFWLMISAYLVAAQRTENGLCQTTMGSEIRLYDLYPTDRNTAIIPCKQIGQRMRHVFQALGQVFRVDEFS